MDSSSCRSLCPVCVLPYVFLHAVRATQKSADGTRVECTWENMFLRQLRSRVRLVSTCYVPSGCVRPRSTPTPTSRAPNRRRKALSTDAAKRHQRAPRRGVNKRHEAPSTDDASRRQKGFLPPPKANPTVRRSFHIPIDPKGFARNSEAGSWVECFFLGSSRRQYRIGGIPV